MPSPSLVKGQPLPGVASWAAEVNQLWIAYRALGRSQWLAPEEVERGQLAQARTLLAHCLANVPYYHRPTPLEARDAGDVAGGRLRGGPAAGQWDVRRRGGAYLRRPAGR